MYDEKILMEKLHADTVNIAIVREPLSRAQSAFNYFHLAKTMNISGTDPFATFIDNLDMYCGTSSSKKGCAMIQDLMVREFGCVPEEEDLSQCLRYIESK